MKLTIKWRDGEKEAEMVLDGDFDDGDVIYLPHLPQDGDGGAWQGDLDEYRRSGRPN